MHTRKQIIYAYVYNVHDYACELHVMCNHVHACTYAACMFVLAECLPSRQCDNVSEVGVKWGWGDYVASFFFFCKCYVLSTNNSNIIFQQFLDATLR